MQQDVCDAADVEKKPPIVVEPPEPDSLQVHVTNPTAHRRIQPVIFGTRDQTKYTFRALPRSYLNVGVVDVPANYIGLTGVHSEDRKRLDLHPTISKAIAGGLKIFVMVNGQKVYLEPTVTHELHKDVFIHEYQARSAVGIAKLWTYTFHNYPAVHIELGFYCESLVTSSTSVNLSFGVEGMVPCFYKFYNGNAALLLNGVMDDTQGKVWRGVMGFYVPQVITAQDFETFVGEWEWPIMPIAQWPTWGPWDKALPPIPQALVDTDIAQRKGINYNDTFAHYGNLGAMMSGTTGDQGGWGSWQSMLTVGARQSQLLWFDYLAAMQDNVRPVHYFEQDGSRFQANRHPNAVFWSQRLHYHHGVASDRLGRIHNGATTTPWSGYDDQHSSGTWIANTAILTGSFAAMDYCKGHIQAIIAQETLPSLKPGWSTNGYHGGRGARMAFTAVMHYLATGDPAGITHAAAQLNETMFNPWIGYGGQPVEAHSIFSHPTWQIHPTSLKGPGPAAGQLALYPSWTVWEDGLWAMCYDALWPIFLELGFVAEATKLKQVVYAVAKSVTMYGWHPTIPAHCAVALKWNGDGTPCEDYLDPDKAKYFGGYGMWMVPCLEICKREARAAGEHDVVARAIELLTLIAPTVGSYTKYNLQFVGAH